jgi:hypothetical protein
MRVNPGILKISHMYQGIPQRFKIQFSPRGIQRLNLNWFIPDSPLQSGVILIKEMLNLWLKETKLKVSLLGMSSLVVVMQRHEGLGRSKVAIRSSLMIQLIFVLHQVLQLKEVVIQK